MAIVVGALITLVLLGGLTALVLKLSQPAARRVWLIVFSVLLASSVAYMDAHAFLAKWAFKGDHPRDGLIAMVEATASRPFVYRRLAPEVVGAVTRFAMARLPERAFEYFEESSRLHRYKGDWSGQESWDRRKAVAFHAAYFLVAVSFFGAVLAGAALWQVVRQCSWFEAICTASVAMCFAPLMFVGGGYIYDAPELMLWTALLWVALRGFWFGAPALFALMLLNKESAILVLPALAALLYLQNGWVFAAKWLALLGAIGVGWSLYVRAKYAGNPGDSMELHLPGNLEFWANPKHYLLLAPLYSPALPSPRGANLVLLLLVALPLRFGWRTLRRDLRWATGLTAAILIPLLITSCFRDEVRNLSLLFPLLFVAVAQGVHELLQGARSPLTAESK
jgi:hypothetical protein